MSSRSSVKTPKNQQGIALLILMIVIVLAFATYSLSGLSINQVNVEQQKKTRIALKKAKQALIAYAATYGDIDRDSGGNADFPGEYGFLPCPDYNNGLAEGLEDSGNCGARSISKLGFLPWSSLDVPILRDGSGACLLYAVSGEYKNDESDPISANSYKSKMLNEDTNGTFQVVDVNNKVIVGDNPEDRVVAIVFAPNKSLIGQNRTYDNPLCGDHNWNEYLEGNGVTDNATLLAAADSIDQFLHGTNTSDKGANPYNDQFITITKEEIWSAVTSRRDFVMNANSEMRRQTEALAWCIAAYGNNNINRKLPRPAPVDFAGADYRVDANYDDTVAFSYLGRYPHTVDSSDAALGVANAPNSGETTIFNKGFCDALPILVSGGPDINLNTVSDSEGYAHWKNWKDHFLYSVSAYYAPDIAISGAAPQCMGNGSNCITVGAAGSEFAAVILYSGSRTGVQTRNGPIVIGDVDTKKSIGNYLEVNNPAGDGTGDYTPTGNDIAFCVTDTNPFAVVACP